MSKTNGTPQTKSQLPEGMDPVEWRQLNVKKGIIDAIVEIADYLQSMHGSENTGNTEALIDYIDELIGLIGLGIPYDYVSVPETKRILEEKGPEAFLQYLETLKEKHWDTRPAYMKQYLYEDGRVTGYMNTLKMIRQLAEMMGY